MILEKVTRTLQERLQLLRLPLDHLRDLRGRVEPRGGRAQQAQGLAGASASESSDFSRDSEGEVESVRVLEYRNKT